MISAERKRMLALLTILCWSRVATAWSHGGGSMPDSHPANEAHPEDTRRAQAERVQNKLTKLQEKIDKLDERLEDSNLPPKKRAKLEKKLKKLLAEKERLLGG
jgi:uncharacterized protein YlxW (UPF0749 family)